MMYLTGVCPLCGLDIIMDTKSDNPDIIKIRTKRRSTVLVHKDCYRKAQGVHYDIQSHLG